jgi:hypothetical protein
MDLMRILVEIIPHSSQRYPTVGDWVFTSAGNLHINVSKMSTYKREFLVAVHEMVEAVLCKEAGVAEEDVTAFDVKFEAERARGLQLAEAEPGNDYRAPYKTQHEQATSIEALLASYLNVNWEDYDDEVSAL